MIVLRNEESAASFFFSFRWWSELCTLKSELIDDDVAGRKSVAKYSDCK